MAQHLAIYAHLNTTRKEVIKEYEFEVQWKSRFCYSKFVHFLLLVIIDNWEGPF